MRHKAKYQSLRPYYILLVLSICLVFVIEIFKNKHDIIEFYYSKNLYSCLSYFYMILFSWVPFSIGDVVYVGIITFLVALVIILFKNIFRKNWQVVKVKALQLICSLLLLYCLFYFNWGLNYFRYTIPEKYGLNMSDLSEDDHLTLLESYIAKANDLRKDLPLSGLNKRGVKQDIEEIVRHDTIFEDFLIKSQIHIKNPISSKLISYFTVSGYFNPFTLEAHINEEVPLAGYPFTVAHELAHQQGVGFEDECNFIAFEQLKDSKDKWYAYSAYFSAIQYLFQPLFGDEKLVKKYKDMLSPEVLSDLREEREFWMSYMGWVDKISGVFYDNYLKHNNQPEGINRYNMMTKLILAWDKKKSIEK